MNPAPAMERGQTHDLPSRPQSRTSLPLPQHRSRREQALPLRDLRVLPARFEHRGYLTTSDDLLLRWESEDRDDEVVITLRETTTGASHTVRARRSEGRSLIRASDLGELRPPLDWRGTDPYERYLYRLEMQAPPRALSLGLGLIEIRAIIRVEIKIDAEGKVAVTVSGPGTTNGTVPHDCAVQLQASQKRRVLRAPVPDESLDVSVVRGRGEAAFPDRFEPDLKTLRYQYAGSYAEELVRISVTDGR